MIELRNISKTFHKGTANEIQLLDRFNLKIESGEFVVLIGSNGSGKSTLLNLLAGTIHPDEGEILLDGKDISRLKDYERSKWIARIFQDPLAGTSQELSILENFRLAAIRGRKKGLRIGTGEAFRAEVSGKIAKLNLGLEKKLDQNMGTLSGGQRQALTLLMATMDDTRLLLLDEPAAALDPKTAALLMELASEIIKSMKLTAIMVTHQMKDMLKYGDRLVQLHEGKMIRDVNAGQKQNLQLNDVFTWFGE